MHHLKYVVAAILVLAPAMSSAQVQSDHSRDLLQQLHDADPADAKKIERELDLVWARSGSPSMDLLMTRGQDALEAGEVEDAIGHFSALIDHAPDFAEAYHRRATAFFRQEELGLALSDLAQVLTLNPDHFEATYGLGVVMETLDRTDEAFDAYSRVLDTYPTHERALEAVERLRTRVSGQSL
ncbi:tetratricopeptide repeat protein [Pseudooceanicola onchidii]|uniref:tetratricopeptide repeat protein n=1 Tax=Pseudooceanicola onchidii TaxID=2562279 RepID=UPI001F0EBA90|nr:tetratricopeptide repeat protein [Pseudooceanicola onchidii]